MPVPRHAPYVPPAYDLADAHAIRAVAEGRADPDQQKRAMRWIIEKACGTYEDSFRPEGDRDTILACGRRFVGLRLVTIINLSRETLEKLRLGKGRPTAPPDGTPPA
jgi:hypothetical protein